MSTTQPIRNLTELELLKNYYLNVSPNLRNYALICTGINTALRISDIRLLKWENIYDFKEKRFREHLSLTEQKTGKQNCIAMNHSLIQAFSMYMDSLEKVSSDAYIFTGNGRTSPLSRSQAFRIIRDAARDVHLSHAVSCHSLRKTFGYHAWRAGVAPVVIMSIYNHSSFHITTRYLGIEQDDKDNAFLKLNL